MDPQPSHLFLKVHGAALGVEGAGLSAFHLADIWPRSLDKQAGGLGWERCRWTLRQQPQTVAYPAAPSGLGPGLYPGLGFWDLPTRGYDYRVPDCRIPRSGTCSGLSGLQQVLPCSLVKLGSKATRQERWPPLGVIQSFPAPQGLPGGPQSLQVGGPCSRRAPPQTRQDPRDACCHLHADLLRTGLDGGPGHELPRGSQLHLLGGREAGGLSERFESSSARRAGDPLWPLLGPVLMALSLLAGTGKVPYQFTTLGQATTEFSKPLDGSGLFKNNPGTHLFCITPLFSPIAGQLGHPTGLSATSRVSWSLPSPQSPLAEDACPTPPPS